MNRLPCAALLLIIACMQTALSGPKELILQNGLNNYTGCHDSYIESENPYDINYRLGDLGLHYEVYVGS